MELIAVNNLRKEYGDTIAVDGISFGVQRGEVFGLLGPNGAGKSTTISMMTGLVTPNAGQIYLKGSEVSQEMDQVKRVLGLVPQDVALYPTLTARENLQFWGKMFDVRGHTLQKRVDAVLEYAGLTDRADEKIEKYSGGMKRRINIAAALVHQPELLIMDEPTVGIDPQSRNHILETVLRLNQEGMTVIYTSHYMEEVEYLCNRIAIMDHGKIIAQGTKQDLRQMIGDADRITVELQQANPQLVAKLKEVDGVRSVEIEGNKVVILVKDGRQKLAQLLTVINADSMVQSVEVQEPNLESVFLHLTGRALRD